MAAPVIEQLRKQLRERFPQAHGVRAGEGGVENGGETTTLFDWASFPCGQITEVVPAGPGAGLALWVAGLLGEPERASAHPELVLVDGADGFDPASFSGAACSRLLWVRCRSALEMVKAADLVVCDGNVPLVLLDATGLAAADLGGLPASAWWRLKQGAERGGCRLVVMAPWPVVPCAGRRLVLSAKLGLEDFDQPRGELLTRLRAVEESGKRVVG